MYVLETWGRSSSVGTDIKAASLLSCADLTWPHQPDTRTLWPLSGHSKVNILILYTSVPAGASPDTANIASHALNEWYRGTFSWFCKYYLQLQNLRNSIIKKWLSKMEEVGDVADTVTAKMSRDMIHQLSMHWGHAVSVQTDSWRMAGVRVRVGSCWPHQSLHQTLILSQTASSCTQDHVWRLNSGLHCTALLHWHWHCTALHYVLTVASIRSGIYWTIDGVSIYSVILCP